MSARLLRALDFAADRHREQRRKGPSGAPYVNHLIEVAMLLSDVGGIEDVDVLTAAVLHDIVEDTSTSLAEVGERFGARVRTLVEALSDDKLLSKAERKRLVLEHLQGADASTRLVKLADLCSNLRSLPVDWSTERIREYIEWSSRAAALCAGQNTALDALYQERLRAAREALTARTT